VRVSPDASAHHLARVLLAAAATGAAARVSLHPDVALDPRPALDLMPGATLVVESTAAILSRLAPPALGRIRLLGTETELATLEPAVHVDARPPVLVGRVELLRYLREQAVSRTLHRYGNVVRPFDEGGPPAEPGPPTSTSQQDGAQLDDADDRWLAAVDRGA
jgi:RHH-type proline utilization regulon transcriptional repressor/proline dehydrogenase/delta 1-pyrroline-5-carboxylate dehydrogenase